jgi:hypothetical protein
VRYLSSCNPSSCRSGKKNNYLRLII